ncbi:MAG: hypothetical protein ACYTG0_34905 [Planctomycetota bacterium]|jgi:hypothetical protein
MSSKNPNRTVTRRAALGQMLAASTGVAAAASIGLAQKANGKAGVLVEREPAGTEIWQVTTERVSQSNIYCEVPYCSSDSKHFVYQRSNPKATENRTELMVVELGTWEQHRLDTTIGLGGSAISHDGLFYYLKRTDDGATDLLRADLADGSIEKVYRLRDDVRVRSLGTVTTDRRYYAGGTKVDPGWTMFDVLLVDLEKGDQRILDRDPFILNPHPQFEPGKGRQLMIQHNRGGTYSADGKLERLVGPEGATLYVLSVPEGKRTELQVGKPYTTACTGHEAWIGDTREMLLSVSARDDYAPEKGNLLGVRAGSPARVVARGYRFNHVGVSRCGRFFSADDWQGTYKIVVGSVETGKTAVICDSKTSPSRSQSTHPHPYLTPNLQWVIFNSNRDGFPHVYAARVPDGMMEELAKA